jgi:hypothetical protein
LKQNLTAWDVEKEVFGANHGEIGAYLLGLWGMPLNVLQAAALHHEPWRSADRTFSPLTAVHVANVLEHEASPDELCMIPPKLDEAYIAGLHLAHRVESWRAAVFTRDGVTVDPRAGAVRAAAPPEAQPFAQPSAQLVMQPAEPVPQPILQLVAQPPEPSSAPIPAPRSLQPSGWSSRTRWLLVGATAGILLLLAWLSVDTRSSQPQSPQTAPAASSTPNPVPHNPAVAPDVQPTTDQAALPAKLSDAAPVKPAAAATQGLPFFSPVVVRARSSTSEPVASSPAPAAPPEFKLQSILFFTDDPSAIINGKTVRPNDRVGGALVVAITTSNVTLESQNQRKILTVR